MRWIHKRFSTPVTLDPPPRLTFPAKQTTTQPCRRQPDMISFRDAKRSSRNQGKSRSRPSRYSGEPSQSLSIRVGPVSASRRLLHRELSLGSASVNVDGYLGPPLKVISPEKTHERSNRGVVVCSPRLRRRRQIHLDRSRHLPVLRVPAVCDKAPRVHVGYPRQLLRFECSLGSLDS